MSENLKSIMAFCTPELADNIKSAVKKAGCFVFLGSACRALDVIAQLNAKTADLVIAEHSEQNTAGFMKLSQYLNDAGIPFIVVCEQAKYGFSGLNMGAKNMIVLRRDSENSLKFFVSMLSNTITTVASLGRGEIRPLKKTFTDSFKNIVVIGASTGGSEAVLQIMKEMPEDAPPIVTVMHMPPVFTRIFAERIHSVCKISSWEARDGDRLKTGLLLVAKGDKHISLNKDDDGYFVSIYDGELIGGHRPSIDNFFNSVAKTAQNTAIGVILTGMGADGAAGITRMRKAGAHTIGQDKESSVVYGMPKVAYEMGGVALQVPLCKIATKIMEASIDS